ncbi:hypothetical protein DWS26_04950 [Escherichia coli]|nr:hypothetical protein [Escherichia coli]EFN7901924.1 hypothetical protein [Escherichia coli]EFO0157096.1 hypothetical protein [Escherichia coli]EFO0879783.1 hypothetical protein [Escherichia coli]EFO1596245.1 hypothetical protein [Escherichia coli]
MLRLAGELPIVRVLNDFQLLSILRIFCMRGFLPPPTDPPWLYASVSGLLCARSGSSHYYALHRYREGT